MVVDEELKGAIQGQASLLFKRLGDAKLSGQIETSRQDIFLKAPQGAQAAMDRAYFVAVCTLVMEDTTLSTDEKLERLNLIKQGFAGAAPTAGSGTWRLAPIRDWPMPTTGAHRRTLRGALGKSRYPRPYACHFRCSIWRNSHYHFR